MEWSPSRNGKFTHGERAPGTQWIDGWVCPRTGLDAVARRENLSACWDRTPVVQPVEWTSAGPTSRMCNSIICWLRFSSLITVRRNALPVQTASRITAPVTWWVLFICNTHNTFSDYMNLIHWHSNAPFVPPFFICTTLMGLFSFASLCDCFSNLPCLC